MKVLETTRVAIVDDDLEEGTALLKAFSKAGIGATYFSGAPEEYPNPDKKLKGIRVLALDMDLTGAGPAVNLDVTVQAVDSILAKESGPFVIIAWTKYTEFVDAFKKRLQEIRPDLKFLFITKIAKEDFRKKDNHESFDVEKILEKLMEEMKKWSPLDLIMLWEQRVHDAATETTDTLSQFVEAEQDWQDGMLNVLAILAHAAGGKTLQDGPTAFRALLEALNPIHLDRLEQLSLEPESPKANTQRLATLTPSFKEDKKALMNRMLLIAEISRGNSHPQPGNVYCEEGWKCKIRYPISPRKIKLETLAGEIFDSTRKKPKNTTLEEIIEGCVPVLVEITPTCDYAQGRRYARLVAGVIVPCKYHKKIKDALFIKKIGPVNLRETAQLPLSGNYYLAFNSHYLVGMSYDDLERCGIVFRLRRQTLVDIQHWFASHAARPGVLSI